MIQLPLAIKSIFWQFVRGDMLTNDFEQWVYSNKELELLFEKNSYLELIMPDYQDSEEIRKVKLMIYGLLLKEKQICLCATFPNNTLLYPFTDEMVRNILLNQIGLFKLILTIDNFSGKSPIHQSRWYQPAKVCQCNECSQYWVILFEESEGADYYLIRLSEKEAANIIQNPTWPNEQWPIKIKNWHTFLGLNFQSWNNLYIKPNYLNNHIYEFLKIYH